MRLRLIVVFLALLSAPTRAGEPNNGSAADYERVKSLGRLFADKVLNARVQPEWTPNGSRLSCRIEHPDGTSSFEQIDADKGTQSPAFDSKKLAAALSTQLKKPVEEKRLPISRAELLDDGSAFKFVMNGRVWRCKLDDYSLTDESSAPSPEQAPRRGGRAPRRPPQESARPSGPVSPDGKWTAFAKDYNLWMRAKDSKEEFQLSKDGKADDFYSEPFYWSQDSQHLVVLKTKRGGDRKVYLVESSPADQLQPKLNNYDYLKPGDKIPQAFPQLFDIASKTQISVDTALFPNPWIPDTGGNHYRWDADGARFLFLYNQRGHQVMRLLAIDAKTGAVKPIINEECKTFFDYSGKEYLHYADDTRELIWMSERDGWNHLYLIDAQTGAVKNQITKGEWVVRGVDRVDEKARQIWFRARWNLSGAGSLLRPFLPHQFRRHEPRQADRRRRHARDFVFARRALSDRYLFARGSAARDGTAPRGGWETRERNRARGRIGAAENRLARAGTLRRKRPRRHNGHLRNHCPPDEL